MAHHPRYSPVTFRRPPFASGAQRRHVSAQAFCYRSQDHPITSQTTLVVDDDDADGDVAMNDDMQSDGQTFDAHAISHTLEVTKDSVLAADCCIALLSSDRLNKQVILLSIYERGGSDFTHTSLAFY